MAEPSAHFFGAVTIEGKRCSSSGCGGEPVAAMPWRTPEEEGIVWSCLKHAEAGEAKGLPLQEISRTCGRGKGPPCGAAATHLAMVGVPGMGLTLVSVCARHLEAERA
jgi:hypothetical protein